MQVTTQYYLKGPEEALERARKIAETFDWVEFCSPEIPNSNTPLTFVRKRDLQSWNLPIHIIRLIFLTGYTQSMG